MACKDAFVKEAANLLERFSSSPSDKALQKDIISVTSHLKHHLNDSSGFVSDCVAAKFYKLAGNLIETRLALPGFEGNLDFDPVDFFSTYVAFLEETTDSDVVQSVAYLWLCLSRACPDLHEPFYKSSLLEAFYTKLDSSLELCIHSKLEVLQLLTYILNSPACKTSKLPKCLSEGSVLSLSTTCASWKKSKPQKCFYTPKNVDGDLPIYLAQAFLRCLIMKEHYYDFVDKVVKSLCEFLRQSNEWYVQYSIIGALNLTLDEPVNRRDRPTIRQRIMQIEFDAIDFTLCVEKPNVVLMSIVSQLLYEIINRWESFSFPSTELKSKLSVFSEASTLLWVHYLRQPPTENEAVYSAACLSLFLGDERRRRALIEAGVVDALITQLNIPSDEKIDEKQHQKLLYVCRGLMALAADGPERQMLLFNAGVLSPLLNLLQKNLVLPLDFAIACLLTNISGDNERAKAQCLDLLSFRDLLKVASRKCVRGSRAGPYLMFISNLVDMGGGRVRPSIVGDIKEEAVGLMPLFESFLLSTDARDDKALAIALGLLQLSLKDNPAAISSVSPKLHQCLTAFAHHPWAREILKRLPSFESSPISKYQSPATKAAEADRTKCSFPNCASATSDLKKCARCKLVAYCSKDCQKKDWSSHKKDCSASKLSETK